MSVAAPPGIDEGFGAEGPGGGPEQRTVSAAVGGMAWIGRHKLLLAGLIMCGSLILVAILASVLAPGSPDAVSAGTLAPPSAHHWFGTDSLGRDIYTRVVRASTLSVAVAVAATAVAGVLGVSIGVGAALAGKAVDTSLSKLIELLMAFPALLFALALIAVLGTSTRNLILAMGVLFVPRFARVARAIALSTMKTDYVMGARVLGASRWRIARRYLWPNVRNVAIVESSLTMSIALLLAAALAFLGLGIPPPTPTWGGMISDSVSVMTQAPWTALFPASAICYVVLSFNLLGDGLRDALSA